MSPYIKTLQRITICLTGIALLIGNVCAEPPPPELPLIPNDKSQIIETVSSAFIENYIFLEDAQKMEKLLKKNLKKGKYDAIKTRSDLAEQLTLDLRSINNDRHITIEAIHPDISLVMDPSETEDKEEKAIALKKMQEQNFMFRKIEILEGNIGYLRFDMFADASVAGPTAIAAMNFMAHCDAIIFDMRYNGGGNPSMIQLLTSYLVKAPTHLNSFYIRKTDTTQQFWTQSLVPGPSLVNTDVYVLTSSYTFSGAEEFTYNLKNLKRATIIGETTGGGAHPINVHPFPELGIAAFIPFGRAINPISGTNWEGTGVTPDIKVDADDALLTAQQEALKKLKETATNPKNIKSLEWAQLTIESQINPPSIDTDTLKTYAGIYQDRQVQVSASGILQYRRGSQEWTDLNPMSQTIFQIDGIEYFRLEVILNDLGEATKLVGHYSDGRTDESEKTTK